MPIYEYKCPMHGRFQRILPQPVTLMSCPDCGMDSPKVLSMPARTVVVERERLPLGSKSRGKLIPASETGGMGILIPSFGVLDKEEVDYLAKGAVEKERERVAKKGTRPSRYKGRIQTLMNEAYKASPGSRAKTMRKLIDKEGV